MGKSDIKPAFLAFHYGMIEGFDIDKELAKAREENTNKPKPLDESNLTAVQRERLSLLKKYPSLVSSPVNVLYPFSGFDFGPSFVFPDVHYVDVDYEAIDYLQSHGLKATHTGVDQFDPSEKFDLVLLINPERKGEMSVPFSLDNVLNHVKVGGHIVANDRTGAASHIRNYQNNGRFSFFTLLNLHEPLQVENLYIFKKDY